MDRSPPHIDDAEIDALLKQATQADVPRAQVDDGELLAFRNGTMSAAEQERFEERLALSPPMRELARLQLLPGAEGTLAWPTGRRSVSSVWRAPFAWAASVLMCLGAASWVLQQRSEPAARYHAYEIGRIDGGLMAHRGAAEAGDSSQVTVSPQGQLALFLRPTQPQRAPAVSVLVSHSGAPFTPVTSAHQTPTDGGGLILDLPVARALPAQGNWRVRMLLGDDCGTGTAVAQEVTHCQTLDLAVSVVEQAP